MDSNLISIIIPTYNRAEDLTHCLDSILESVHKNYEIIVVDNASTDNTVDLLEKKYKDKIKLIKSNENLMAGGGRNLGAEYAKGNHLLFVDTDNIIDRKMISELLSGINEKSDAGMVGPIMYYLQAEDTIWWAGVKINPWTSRTTYIGIGEKDKGQYGSIRKVDHIPNVFMIKKSVWNKVGGIDPKYVMHYEESDLAERIKKEGLSLYIIPKAKTWHNTPLQNKADILSFGGESMKRAYYTARNRIIFMRKNYPFLNFFIFLLVFNNIFALIYLFVFIKQNRWDLAQSYLKGAWDGAIKK